jgi:hypothetical protein
MLECSAPNDERQTGENAALTKASKQTAAIRTLLLRDMMRAPANADGQRRGTSDG